MEGQIDDLVSRGGEPEVEKGHKVLITTLTKRMAKRGFNRLYEGIGDSGQSILIPILIR